MTPSQSVDLEVQLKRLEQGEPLPYVIGEWEFYGLCFSISPAVLISRPETELLVETALAWLRVNPTRRLALDVGTGSGCIAVALSVHTSDLRLVAVDCSSHALSIASENIRRHGLEGRVEPFLADLFPDPPPKNTPDQISPTAGLPAAGLPPPVFLRRSAVRSDLCQSAIYPFRGAGGLEGRPLGAGSRPGWRS